MESENNSLNRLAASVQEYIETRAEIVRLSAVEKSSRMAASLVSMLVFVILLSLVLVFLSIALAYGLSEWIGRAYSGFLIVGGMYLLTALVLFLNREKWLKAPVMNQMIRNLLKRTHVEED
ncbi:MAG: phage holin family protein [Bacteroidia bacterium]|nr:phage holin family protein [Bacteroidia bacterium]